MELVYLTAKHFPATTADHVYIRFLALAFSRLLGKDFTLVIAGEIPDELGGMRVRSVRTPRFLRTLFYFFWLPSFIHSRLKGGVKPFFFCNDFNLLGILAFWKPFFRDRYGICSDWHLMTDSWKDWYVARASDHLITTSARLKACIVEQTGTPVERVSVVYGGIDPEPYREPFSKTREELQLPEGYLVGYVGLFRTMGKEKGLKTMIDALAMLPSDVHMAFVGGSPAEIDEYRAYARAHDVLDRCVFIDKQPFEGVVAYERSMDALVIPYPDEPHFRNYGFPMKAYEYIAAGKPVIYSGLEMLDEVFAGRGVPFVPGDASSLAHAVLIARSGEVREGKIHENFSWDAKAGEILSRIGISDASLRAGGRARE